MKITSRFLLTVSLLIPFQWGLRQIGIKPFVIILNASQVTSAVDIETAIRSATAEGTRFGIVVLDGREGEFRLTGDDRSINIFVSNLILRGVNRAAVQGCDDGLFFDDFPLKHITVSEIAFYCNGDGIEASGKFTDVILKNNIIQAKKTGISVAGGSSQWKIMGNLVLAGEDAVRLTAVEKVVITGNHIAGTTAIMLFQSSNCLINDNSMQASTQGVLLGQEAWQNIIQNNSILGVNAAGIGLEPGVSGNGVLDNWVLCALETTCQTVDAASEIVEMNTITGNRP